MTVLQLIQNLGKLVGENPTIANLPVCIVGDDANAAHLASAHFETRSETPGDAPICFVICREPLSDFETEDSTRGDDQ